ncbi:MAG TPA: hypothetical protein EYN06_10395 [Myxococcales bacterium]|nr:hypothetical protein [Myxococcales bacterium]HIN86881.1 hypothetical protein [Myxococcales bacterium]
MVRDKSINYLSSLLLIVLVAFLATSAEAQSRFEVGRQDSFTLKYRSVSATDVSQLKGKNAESKPRLIDATVTGLWVRTVVSVSSESVLVRYEMRMPSVSISMDQKLLKEQSQNLKHALLLPTVAELLKNGQVKGLRFADNVTFSAQGFVRAILSSMHYVTPPDGSKKRQWKTQEVDSQGHFTADYERSSKNRHLVVSGGEAVLKQKQYLQIEDIWHPLIKKESKEIRWQGHALFGVKDKRVLSVDVQEKLNIFVTDRHVSFQDNELEAIFNDSVKLSAERLGKMARDAAHWLKHRPTVKLFEERISNAQEQEIADQRLDGSSVPGLMVRFILYALNPISIRPQSFDLYVRMRGLFGRHPNSPELFRELMETMSSEKSFMLLCGVLGAAGTPESQTVLRAVFEKRSDKDALSQVMMGLARVEKPTEATFEHLEKRASDDSDPVKQHLALQGLAGLALMVRESRPKKARSIVNRLVRAAKNPPAGKLEFYLDLLGTSGSNMALDVLEPHLNSSDEKTRHRAIAALRWMDHPRAERALIKILAHSKIPVERRVALKALGERPPTVAMLQVFKRAARSDSDQIVRHSAVGRLKGWHWHDSSIARLLAGIARKDSSDFVRLAAKVSLDWIKGDVKATLEK